MDFNKLKLINDEMLKYVKTYTNKHYEKTMKNFAEAIAEQMRLDAQSAVPKNISYEQMMNLGNILIKRSSNLNAFQFDYLLAEFWSLYNDKNRDEVFDRLFNKRKVKHKYILDEYNAEDLLIFRSANVNGKSWSVDINVAVNFWFIHTRNNAKDFYNIENIGLFKRRVKQSEIEFMLSAKSRTEAVEVVLTNEAQQQTDNCVKAKTLSVANNKITVVFEDDEVVEAEVNEFYRFSDVVELSNTIDLNADYNELEQSSITYKMELNEFEQITNSEVKQRKGFFAKLFRKKETVKTDNELDKLLHNYVETVDGKQVINMKTFLEDLMEVYDK